MKLLIGTVSQVSDMANGFALITSFGIFLRNILENYI